jgi:hypothetical protein
MSTRTQSACRGAIAVIAILVASLTGSALAAGRVTKARAKGKQPSIKIRPIGQVNAGQRFTLKVTGSAGPYDRVSAYLAKPSTTCARTEGKMAKQVGRKLPLTKTVRRNRNYTVQWRVSVGPTGGYWEACVWLYKASHSSGTQRFALMAINVFGT